MPPPCSWGPNLYKEQGEVEKRKEVNDTHMKAMVMVRMADHTHDLKNIIIINKIRMMIRINNNNSSNDGIMSSIII